MLFLGIMPDSVELMDGIGVLLRPASDKFVVEGPDNGVLLSD
jgi:hypothetical protein